ncbi:MAG: glycoside hydrolase family 78 protein [Bacteroidales bacterium]|nr:glycoside hydrolase family 78 protein [Bacteroidales bacterium]
MKANNENFFWKTIVSFIIAFTLFGCTDSQKEIAVSNMRCEYLENPLGIDMQKPRFSWNISSDIRGTVQMAYQILVAESIEKLKNRTGIIWDSGKILSDNTGNIPYEGSPLKSDKTYYWIVSLWDQVGKQSTWPEPAFFHTGLLSSKDWEANWIAAGDAMLEAPLLRKEFEVAKAIKQAFVYITGTGYYEFYLNGKKVGDHVLDPGMTNYSKRILYATYDVTSYLKTGSNIAGAILGNGAFNLKRVQDRYSWGNKVSGINVPRLLMQMKITFKDGTVTNIITDDSWKSSGSPITFNNLYGGEDYDGRLEKSGWSEKDFDASGWSNVNLVNSPGGIIQSQLMPPIRVTATLSPIVKTNPANGVYLFDIGQNYAGWWRIRAKGEAGLKLRIRGAETLNDSLFPELLKKGDRLSTKHKYHANVWTDYILNGKGEEVYEPRFFYTGIRYIEVTTDNPEKLKMVEVEGRVVGTDLERNGRFVTSDSLLNKIHRATIWAQKSNVHSYPTDCPHREKGGYTGDGQIVAEAAIHDFQMAPLYTKWLADMRDAQMENGRMPNTSPTLIGGNGGGIAWGSAYILIPWWMHQYYNDTRILEEYYPTMKRYLLYLRNLARSDSDPKEAYIINNFGGYWDSLGEWCAPGQSDCPNHPMISTCYYYLNSTLMSKIASLLGNKTDALYFSSLADTIKNEINKKFFNASTYNYGTEEVYQTYQLLALAGDIVSEDYREQVMKTVLDDIIITRKGHLNTGIIGTKYLWPVLAHAGKNDLAYSIIKQTSYPGYGYWIENGATTLLEEWTGKNSHNHQMFGSVDEFFYRYLAGIYSPEDGLTTTGYKHIHIQPYIPKGLSFVDASLNTVAGKIGSSWKQEPGAFRLTVSIPANSTSSINIPLLDFKDIIVSESGKKIWEKETFIPGTDGIKAGRIEGQYLVFNTGSGKYEFTITGN